MRLITWNIKHQRAGSVVETIRSYRAEHIFLQECDFTFPRTLKNVGKEIGRELNKKKLFATQDFRGSFPLFRTGVVSLLNNFPNRSEVYVFKNQYKHFRKAHISQIEVGLEKAFRIAHVHLQSGNKEIARDQLDELIYVVQPNMIVGDLNLKAKDVEGILENTKYKICFLENSFPKENPNKQLDYVLTRNDFKVNEVQSFSNDHSDHLGFFIDLELN